MNPASPGPERRSLLPWFLAGAVGVLAAFHLGAAATGHSLYRDQHLGTALIYARQGIDLLHPVIVGFNVEGTPTILEFPLWQAFAGLLLRWGGGALGWANLASILLLLPALWPLFQWAEAHLGRRAAGWATVAFLLQPIVFVLAGRAGPDGFALGAVIWFLWASDRLIATGKPRWAVAAAGFGALAAVLKLPLFFGGGLAAALMLALSPSRDLRRWVQLAAAGGFAAVVFAAWTRYADHWNALALYPVSDLNFFPNGWRWYLGDWAYRMAPMNYVRGGWRVLVSLFGSFALGIGAVLALGLKGARPAVAMLVAGLVTSLVFTRLVLEHTHYYTLFSPAAALLIGGAFAKVEAGFCDRSRRVRIGVALAGFMALLLSLAQGLIGLEIVLDFDPYRDRIAARLRELTAETDKLVVYGGGWGGEQLILSGRHGFTLHENRGLLKDPAAVGDLRRRGFNKIVLITESPLLVALQKTNPGGARRERGTTADVEEMLDPSWPTLHRDPDLVIREIPRP